MTKAELWQRRRRLLAAVRWTASNLNRRDVVRSVERVLAEPNVRPWPRPFT